MSDREGSTRRVRSVPAQNGRGRIRTGRAATQIHATLHDEIVRMQLKPLDMLNEKQLGQRFGVSRTPVREALLRLADEGLVEIYPQSGTFVSRIPRRALYEAILIRKALEATTVSLAIASMTDDRLRELDANQQALVEAANSGAIPHFHQIDSSFHQLIADIAGYPGIWAVIAQVKVQIDRYRFITLPQQGRLALVIAEHAAIIEGMRHRDDGAAVLAMSHHIGRLTEELADIKDLDPALFLDA
ncbi:GntR family transcriptional regulator [Rhizobium sp. AQ_MP]|uniref:GntR family transcriptional regulator n=1 Tax=Rhizobium sp. AQ_MP TaxID=2761536 RepID=UPI001639AB29|nr:GntR family transcriptional regulator [Rhizobium sp. AQ_MP]MBC2771645.1 GntR family transcriptional regulator [Rhizobium sp. AQ_MP]